jgi:hypothetical protein
VCVSEGGCVGWWLQNHKSYYLILQRKVAVEKLQNLVYHLVRTAFWIRICKPSSDFQSKIDAYPLDSASHFAEISLLPSCR